MLSAIGAAGWGGCLLLAILHRRSVRRINYLERYLYELSNLQILTNSYLDAGNEESKYIEYISSKDPQLFSRLSELEKEGK